MIDSYAFPLVKKLQRTQDVWSFYFDRSQNSYSFHAGQYATLTLPIHTTDGFGSSREFTIASSPLENHLVFTTRIGKSDFKRELLHFPLGSVARVSRPYGGFFLREEIQTPLVFLSGGIGITPFRSIVTHMKQKQLSMPVTLVASFSTIEDMVFVDELEKIIQTMKEGKIVSTISKPANNNFWKGEKGRISQQLLQKYIPDVLVPTYMIAGSPAFVEMIEDIVKAMGVAQEKIKVDLFTEFV